jgi:hypothetical protein
MSISEGNCTLQLSFVGLSYTQLHILIQVYKRRFCILTIVNSPTNTRKKENSGGQLVAVGLELPPLHAYHETAAVITSFFKNK